MRCLAIIFHIINSSCTIVSKDRVDELDERELWTGWSIFDGRPREQLSGKDGLRIPWEVGTVSLTFMFSFWCSYKLHTYSIPGFTRTSSASEGTMVWIGLVKIHLTCSPEGRLSEQPAVECGARVLGAMQVFTTTINSTGVRYEIGRAGRRRFRVADDG